MPTSLEAPLVGCQAGTTRSGSTISRSKGSQLEDAIAQRDGGELGTTLLAASGAEDRAPFVGWFALLHMMAGFFVISGTILFMTKKSTSIESFDIALQIGVFFLCLINYSMIRRVKFRSFPLKWQAAWFPITAVASLCAMLYFSGKLAKAKKGQVRDKLRWDSAYLLLSMNASLASLVYALWQFHLVVMKIRTEDFMLDNESQAEDADQSAIAKLLYSWYRRRHPSFHSSFSPQPCLQDLQRRVLRHEEDVRQRDKLLDELLVNEEHIEWLDHKEPFAHGSKATKIHRIRLHIRSDDAGTGIAHEKDDTGSESGVLAAKVFSMQGVNLRRHAKELDSFQRELNLMSTAAHLSPFILAVHGAFVTDCKLGILMDYCEIGSLRMLLDDSSLRERLCIAPTTPATTTTATAIHTLPVSTVDATTATATLSVGLKPEVALTILLQVAFALRALHEHTPAILHKDLKSANILVKRCYDLDGKSSVHCYVADFGVSTTAVETIQRTLSMSVSNPTEATIGTPAWSSPEYLQSNPLLGKPSDVWSFGVVAWEVCTGRVPYEGLSVLHIMAAIVLEKKQLPVPEHCCVELKGLIRGCWEHSPEERPSFAAVVNTLLQLQRKLGYSSSGFGSRFRFSEDRNNLFFTAESTSSNSGRSNLYSGGVSAPLYATARSTSMSSWGSEAGSPYATAESANAEFARHHKSDSCASVVAVKATSTSCYERGCMHVCGPYWVRYCLLALTFLVLVGMAVLISVLAG